MCVRLSDSEYGDSIGGLERIPSKERASISNDSGVVTRRGIQMLQKTARPSVFPLEISRKRREFISSRLRFSIYDAIVLFDEFTTKERTMIRDDRAVVKFSILVLLLRLFK